MILVCCLMIIDNITSRALESGSNNKSNIKNRVNINENKQSTYTMKLC